MILPARTIYRLIQIIYHHTEVMQIVVSILKRFRFGRWLAPKKYAPHARNTTKYEIMICLVFFNLNVCMDLAIVDILGGFSYQFGVFEPFHFFVFCISSHFRILFDT